MDAIAHAPHWFWCCQVQYQALCNNALNGLTLFMRYYSAESSDSPFKSGRASVAISSLRHVASIDLSSIVLFHIHLVLYQLDSVSRRLHCPDYQALANPWWHRKP